MKVFETTKIYSGSPSSTQNGGMLWGARGLQAPQA